MGKQIVLDFQSIKELCFEGNKLSNEDVMKLADAVKKNKFPRLETLDIGTRDSEDLVEGLENLITNSVTAYTRKLIVVLDVYSSVMEKLSNLCINTVVEIERKYYQW